MRFLWSVMLLVGPGLVHAKTDPSARTQGLLDALMSVKSPPADGSALPDADKQSNRAAFTSVDGFFDFDAMTDLTIKPHRAKFNDAQAKQFKTLFSDLIRLVAYPDSGAFLRKSKRKLKPATTKGSEAQVGLDVDVPEEDVRIDVTFYWQNGKDGWRLIDAAFDGARLSNDYQNQFGRLITKSGVDGLLKKLEDRLAKERQLGKL